MVFAKVHQLLLGFLALSERGITNRFVHLKYVCVTPHGNIKLANYGLFHMTEYGYCVDFSVINWATLAPESYALDAAYDSKHTPGSHETPASSEDTVHIELNSSKSDVWAFGTMLFQFVFGLSSHTESSQQHMSQLLEPSRIATMTIELLSSTEVDGYPHMLRLYEIDEKRRAQVEGKTKPYLIELIKRALVVDPNRRATFHELVEFFERNAEICDASPLGEDSWRDSIRWNLFAGKIRSDHLDDEMINDDSAQFESK